MSSAVSIERSLSQAVDAVAEAASRVEAVLPPRNDSAVLADFLEDDLREGLDAVADIEAHFHDVLEVLRSEALTPQMLIEASDDFRVLRRIESLAVVVAQLRRRLSQAAGQLKNR